MSRYASCTQVRVFPFSRQKEGEEIVIGRPDTAVFLALPPDGVELLDHLAAGRTVGEAQQLYQEQHGELPDVEEFLLLLEQKGFVHPEEEVGASAEAATVSTPAPAVVRYHLAGFPEPVARFLFGRPALLAYAAIILLAIGLMVADPSLLPRPEVLFFQERMTVMRVILMAAGVVVLLQHEMAHLIAARAEGVPSRLGIGHRLWVLVAETDMTGIWGIPRQRRYLPLLAGPLSDALSAALLTLVGFAQARDWVHLSPPIFQLVQAILLTYLLQLFWQCYFFLKTDLYYVASTFFKCKNLMADTEEYLRNWAARYFKWLPVTDQSHIPIAERRVIRWYAWVWVLGRLGAMAVLFGVILPVLWLYTVRFYSILSQGFSANPSAFADVLLLSSIVLAQRGAGIWLWLRSLVKGRR